MSRSATLFALVTISLWSFLAFLASRLSHLPPFLVVGIALCIGGLVGVYQFRNWRVPFKTFLVGLGGLFGYHFLLFTAFQYAPTVEANSINYLWPLLIVLLSPVYLPGYKLKPHHILGALIGLAGAGLVISGGHLSLDIANLKGYVLAAAAALIWASYSLLTKRLPPFPTAAVGGFCLVSGIISLGLYGVSSLSSSQAPVALSLQDWIFLVLIGIGPMGIAFYTWDAALKRGDPRIIGSLTYVTPFCSTLVLVLLGGRSLSWVAGIAILLIVSGAVVGSLDSIRLKDRQPATL
jgi:drug/metabolite transporter (DMT)-like permease